MRCHGRRDRRGMVGPARRNLVGGLAPMLARVFTPLFALMLVALLVGVVWTRGVIDVEREVLILFDVLLVVVLALLLYAFSARDRLAGPGLFDGSSSCSSRAPWPWTSSPSSTSPAA